MFSRGESSRVGLALPIALFACALMLLPGSAVLSALGASHGAPSLAGAPAVAPASPASSASVPHGEAAAPSNYSPPYVPADLKRPTLSDPRPDLLSAVPKDLLTPGPSLGRSLGDLVSYPNSEILSNLGSSVAVGPQIIPGYTSAPAPLGLADYGVGDLGSGTYAYNTSSFRGTVSLEAAPNVTAPTTQSVIDPSGSHLGLVASPYEFSIQLNTVLTNVTIPGTDDGTFWSQNVLDVNATAIHFVDDVWNLSAGSDGYFSTGYPPTLLSGCGLTNLTTLLEVGDGVYQCIGTTIPITAASYPLTIQLYNNASVSAAANDVLQFGYRITGAAGLSATGISDTLTFNNPNGTALPPANPVAFEVNGFSYAPTSPWRYDSELTFGGPIGGSNAVFRSIDGSIALQYAHKGSYKNIPSAYNFGTDTGETAVGIAGYWTSAGTEEINQGPSLLYGLWNGTATNSVASGDIQFQGSVSPDYGFVFVSNVVPGIDGTNLSWVPTTASGTFDSLLPPAIPQGVGASYTTVLYAANQTTEAGASFDTSQSDYAFPASTHTDVIDAPLYMDGEAQAKSLAANVTGYTSGPYDFNGLIVNMPLAFTHLNDYRYPTFVVLQAEGLKTTAIHVNNTYEGPNTGLDLYFTMDYGSSGWLFQPSSPVGSANNYTNQFNIWGSASPKVTNETLFGIEAYGEPFDAGAASGGGGIFYFGDSGALASNITSVLGSYGIANVESHGTTVRAVVAVLGARGLTDIGSSKTSGTNISSYGPYGSIGVDELGSTDPAYTYVNATGTDAYGYASGPLQYLPSYYVAPGSKDASVKDLNSTDGALGAIDSYSAGDTFTNVTTYEAVGVIAGFSSSTTIAGVNANYGSGVGAFGSNYTNITGGTFRNECYDCLGDDGLAVVLGSNYTTFTSPTFEMDYTGEMEGALVLGSNHTTFTSPTVQLGYAFYDTGIGFEYDNYTTVTGAVIHQDLSVNATADESEFDTGGIFGLDDNYTNISGTTIDQVADLGYTYATDAYLEDVDVSSIGIGFEDSNLVKITTTTLTQSSWSGNTEYIYDNGVDLAGIVFEGVDNSSVSGTTITQNVTVFDFYEYYDNSGDLVGFDALGTYNLSVSTTVDHESSYRNDFDAYYDNGVAIYALSDLASELTSVLSTTVWTANVTTDYDEAYDYAFSEGGFTGGELTRTTITGMTLYGSPYGGFDAISIGNAIYANLSKITVTNWSVGAWLIYTTGFNVVDVSASIDSIGVWSHESSQLWVSEVSLTWSSAGLLATEESYGVSISDVSATNATVQAPWAPAFLYFWGYPVAVLTAEDSNYVNVSNVAATNYPAIVYTDEVGGYYDEEGLSQGMIATNLTATGGYAIAILNATGFSLLTQLTGSKVQVGISLYDTAYNSFDDVNVTGATYGIWGDDVVDSYFYAMNLSKDWQGLYLSFSEYDQVWGSTFWEDTSYAAYLFEGTDIELWDNSFIGNNGATSTYSPDHIQAYAGYSQTYYFYNRSTDTGNYWADWHSYTAAGVLAPYYVGDANYDLYPLGAPAGGATIVFVENGLSAGTTWSVTFDGTTESSSGNVLTFGAPSGTTAIDYSVGTVSGYVATPASGSVTPDILTTTVAVAFQATATVTLTETGLASGTSWSATVGGVTSTSTTSSMTFVLPVGNYTYDIVPVSGYDASLSHGNVSLTTHGYSFEVAFSGSSSATSYVPTSTFDPLVAIALGLAALAIVVAILALLRKPKASAPPPATPWQEPPAGPSAGSGGTVH
jgi:hypothetical protein